MKNRLLLLNIFLLVITIFLLFFNVDIVFASAFSIVVSAVLLWTFKRAHGNILSFGFVYLAYNILMHFGFAVINFLISEEPAKELYNWWTLTFLKSEYYPLAILISALAFESFTVAWLLGLQRKQPKETAATVQMTATEGREQNICYALGMVMLGGTFVYFIYLLATGTLSFNMGYMDYRKAIMEDNDLYSWMMVFYPTGLLYMLASSKGKKRLWGLALFIASAIILLITGNKGEVLYVVLAALGVIGYQGKKLSKKLVVFLCVIMFVVIPVVTATRLDGVGEGFSLEFASITDPFLEIGMQIRCVIFSLEGVADGSYEMMYGYSYLKPIFNLLSTVIFPLAELPEMAVDLLSSKSDFFGYGFSQVAEGYLNFGIPGSMLFFAAIGYVLGKLEFKRMSTASLCLLGSILTIMINSSRNVFYFVPGQVAVMLAIFIAIKLLPKIVTRSRS